MSYYLLNIDDDTAAKLGEGYELPAKGLPILRAAGRRSGILVHLEYAGGLIPPQRREIIIGDLELLAAAPELAHAAETYASAAEFLRRAPPDARIELY